MKTFFNVVLLVLSFIFTLISVEFIFSRFYILSFFFFLGGWGCFMLYQVRRRVPPRIKEKIEEQKFKKAVISKFFTPK